MQEFWSGVATKTHLLQVYENDRVFLDSLEGFVGSGFIAGDTVMVIATQSHLKALDQRLVNQGFAVGTLCQCEQYVRLDAGDTLKGFLIDGKIDEPLFKRNFVSLIEKLQMRGRKIRIFGEMVSLLFEDGLHETSLRLEELWNEEMQLHDFTLLCAYPQEIFANEANKLHAVCTSHHTVITGSPHASTEVLYRPAV